MTLHTWYYAFTTKDKHISFATTAKIVPSLRGTIYKAIFQTSSCWAKVKFFSQCYSKVNLRLLTWKNNLVNISTSILLTIMMLLWSFTYFHRFRCAAWRRFHTILWISVQPISLISGHLILMGSHWRKNLHIQSNLPNLKLIFTNIPLFKQVT